MNYIFLDFLVMNIVFMYGHSVINRYNKHLIKTSKAGRCVYLLVIVKNCLNSFLIRDHILYQRRAQ